MRQALWIIVVSLLGLAACAAPREKLGWQSREAQWFDAEILGGMDESGSPVAALAVSVAYRNLVFFAQPDGYVARYTIRAVQHDAERALRSQEWSGVVSVDSYERTRSDETERQTVQLRLDDEAGERPLRIVVSLAVDGTQRRSSTILALSPQAVKKGGTEIGQMSLYRLRRNVAEAPVSPVVLERQQLPDPLLFERSISGHFDFSSGTPWLLFRVFDLRDDAGATHRFKVESLADDRSQWVESVSAERRGVETGVLVEIPVEALRFGRNELRVSVADGKTTAIQLDNLGIDLEDDASWEANVKQVEPIASDDELKLLRDTEKSARETRWASFWRRRDPDPSAPGNERLREHYRRVAYARANYHDGFDDGATSDRGRVYVEHGAPDSVEEFANRHDMLTTWQLWRYQSQRLVYYFRLDGGDRYRLAWFERG